MTRTHTITRPCNGRGRPGVKLIMKRWPMGAGEGDVEHQARQDPEPGGEDALRGVVVEGDL